MLQLTFQLNPRDKTPLYEQLYAAIAGQIRDGSIAPNTKLPGKRSLAAELSVSVNTVETAYQILAAEGYLEARPRSGFFAQQAHEILPFGAGRHGAIAPQNAGIHSNSPAPQNVSAQNAAAQYNAASPQNAEAQPRTAPNEPAGATATNHNSTRTAGTAPAVQFDLAGTGIDPALFPFRTWGRIQKELLYASPELLLRGAAQGDENLRAALAEYLAAYRGVRCEPAQIVVGAGVEYLLSLLAPLLPRHGGVENPGYPRAKAVLENSDITCSYLPLDEKGLSVDALRASGAGFCYVTPSHQYPTGTTMPVGRRAALLQWAREGDAQAQKALVVPHAYAENFAACTQAENSAADYTHPQTGAKTGDASAPPARYIIEDDYDSEFRFDVRPLPCLQGMAGADDHVIYLATFSKSLAPSIRIAAMVLPLPLLDAWHARYGRYASTVSRFEQQTLCRFLEGGYFTRHLARTRGIYKARRNALVAALEEAFGKENLRFQGLHTGLHLMVQFLGGAECTLEDAPHENARNGNRTTANANPPQYALKNTPHENAQRGNQMTAKTNPPQCTLKNMPHENVQRGNKANKRMILHAKSDIEIAARCAAVGVKVAPLSESYAADAQTCPPCCVLLGYGALQETDAPVIAQRMVEALV